MQETLAILGAACVVGAIVGGSLKVAKVLELPVIGSYPRQLLLGGFGLALLVTGLLLPQSPEADTPTQGTDVETPTGLPTFDGGLDRPETRIDLSLDSGPPGQRLTVSGVGFDPGETVEISFSTRTLAETKADERGRFSTEPIVIPEDWPFQGPQDITAQGKSSLRFDDAQFIVQ